MRLPTSEPEEISINMTAMIDIVFQLLVFFIMTFKVVAQEGDFNIKMPLATLEQQQVIPDVLPDLITVKLRAGENGGISSINVDDGETFIDPLVNKMYASLTDYVEQRLAGAGDPEAAKTTEVEFDIDFSLKYSYTVKAIESVSGRILPDGSRKKLIEKIKFKDNSAQGG